MAGFAGTPGDEGVSGARARLRVETDHLPTRLWWLLGALTCAWGFNWTAMKLALAEVTLGVRNSYGHEFTFDQQMLQQGRRSHDRGTVMNAHSAGDILQEEEIQAIICDKGLPKLCTNTITHPKKLKATEWLLEVVARPEVADTRPIFLIHHSELLGELKLQDTGVEKSGLRYYTYNELKPVVPVIMEQGRKSGDLPSTPEPVALAPV